MTTHALGPDTWPQIFITRIVGSEDLPDIEIVTLPTFDSVEAVPSLEALESLILNRGVEEFETIGGSSIDHGGVAACRAALHQVAIDAGIREGLPWNPPKLEAYVARVFESYPVPVMNSPLSGSSLAQMVAAAGSGAAFMAALPHPDLGQITLYFLMIGTTRIVLGAADGVSIGLKQGLSHLILKWMGVRKAAATPRKRKTARPKTR